MSLGVRRVRKGGGQGRAPGQRESGVGSAALAEHLLPTTALIFDGSTNPAHPKHIGSIDPNCNISEVVKGQPSRVCLARRWPILQWVGALSP